MTGAIAADISGRDLLKIAIAGLVSGLLTPLAPRLIDSAFGGWPLASKTHFADGGTFDQIYVPNAKQ